jgi:hypothetical protein
MNIHTSKASIETFGVTIRLLHVDKKKMTLAVFRQIPKGEADDNSTNWGVVYYPHDDEQKWLVFSRGERLYKRAIMEFPRFGIRSRESRVSSLKEAEFQARIKQVVYEDGEALSELESNLRRLAAVRKAQLELDSFESEKAKEREFYEQEKRLINDLPQLFIAL